MTWQPPPRPAAARAAIEGAEADRRADPERYRLDPHRVAALAARHVGGDDLFTPGWQAGLEHYLQSADADGRLTALGAAMVLADATSRLRAGAGVARFLRERPERAAAPLAPPIVVVGGWRTGTTFLFRMLATDPRLRAPLPAELATPGFVARLDPEAREAHLDGFDATIAARFALNPGMRAIHDSGARLPEECILGLGTDLRNWGLSLTVRLDGYVAWLAQEDHTASYRRYRDLLKVHDAADGRRWVLKAPAHLAELPTLESTFPGAVVVHLHRDIVETIASASSLFATFRSSASNEVDPLQVGRFQVDQTERWLRRALAHRRAGAGGATHVDLAYADLVADPAGALATVYAAADLDPPGDLGARVAQYQRAHPLHEHGVHRYAPGDFGLDAGELRERFAFLEGWPMRP